VTNSDLQELRFLVVECTITATAPNDDQIHPLTCRPYCPPISYIIRRSTLVFNSLICGIRSLASFVVIDAAMTALETPQARPSATLLGTYLESM
jgi:hypothetical protein